MAKRKIKTYPPELLPSHFTYPDSFQSYIEDAGGNDLYPWYFFDVDGEVGFLRRRLARERKLVPFASLELGDGDVACFDTSIESANPKIIMMVLDGSGRAYAFDDFDHWLSAARAEARKWDFSPAERDAMDQ